MSARSKLSADAPAWYPSTFVEAVIEVCPATEPPSVAEEAKQAPVSRASSSDTVSLQASVESGSETGSATDSRGSVLNVEAMERGQEPKGAQTLMRGASAGAIVAPSASYTGLPVTPRDVAIARDYEEEENDRDSKEKGNSRNGSTHAASDSNGSDESELGATSPEGHSSSTARRRLTRGQLWGLGIAALGAVALVVGLSKRRHTG